MLSKMRAYKEHPEGLLITFNRGTVDAAAAGERTVLVPYSELQAIIDPQGPLAEIHSKVFCFLYNLL